MLIPDCVDTLRPSTRLLTQAAQDEDDWLMAEKMASS
jgi:hypothetical protein